MAVLGEIKLTINIHVEKIEGNDIWFGGVGFVEHGALMVTTGGHKDPLVAVKDLVRAIRGERKNLYGW